MLVENPEMADAYNACISSTDPRIKEEACTKYKALSSGASASRNGISSFANGGEVSFLEDPDMIDLSDDEGEDGYEMPLLERAESTLSEEDLNILTEALDMHPDLSRIFDELIMSVEEFEGEGSVEGPGTETSDSIPAKLSDGEFVFTAKAVKQIGVDKLYKMMKKAEEEFDTASVDREADQEFAMGGFVQRKCK